MIPATIRSDADELLRARYGVGRTVLRADEHAPLAGGLSFVPMAHAYQEPHPAGRTLPGHDLEVGVSRVALASGATGDAPAPPSMIRLLSAEEFAEHERLFGRVYTEEPCDCGDCLSCEVQRIGRRLPGLVRELLSSPEDPRFVLGAEL